MISFFELPLGGNQRRVLDASENVTFQRVEEPPSQGQGRDAHDFVEQDLRPQERTTHAVHQPAYGVNLHQMRANPPSALEQLTTIHHALSQSFRQLGDVMQRTDFADRRNTAFDVANAVLQVLGLQPPRIDLPDSPILHQLPVPELVQLIMFLMGRAHAGRAEATAELVHRSLFQAQQLSREEAGHLLSNPARTPILYAALGAWMFSSEMRPDPRSFLGPEAEPLARDCALILRALDGATT